MGCTSSHLVIEGKVIKQEKIILNIPSNCKNKELSQAQSLINLITLLRNQVIYYYDKLIYRSGACLYKKPNMSHCIKCILYKVSCELNGQLENANFSYKEDPPFVQVDLERFTDYTQDILKQLFNFVILLRRYKSLVKQIDKETPKLIYLIFENNDKISKDNIDKLNKAINLFKELTKLRSDILQEYKNQIYDLITLNQGYEKKINAVGEYAAKNNISDIYEIAFLKSKDIEGINCEKKFMFSNIQWAKKLMENKLKQEIVEENEISLLNIIEIKKSVTSGMLSVDLPSEESVNKLLYSKK